MKKGLWLMALVMLIPVSGDAGDTEEERAARQGELDAACEVAREKKLTVARAKLVEECVEKKERPDRASCERYYADYGAATADRGALFYDLPECEKAWEHKTSHRRSDR